MQTFWPEFQLVGMNSSWAWQSPFWNTNQLSRAPLPYHILNWNIFREKPMQTSHIMCHHEQRRCSVLYQTKLYSKGLHSYIKQIPITQTWLMQLHHLKHQQRALSTSASLSRTTSLGQNSLLAHPHTETMNTVPIYPCITEGLNNRYKSKETTFVICNSLMLPNHQILTYNLRVK